MYKIGTDIVKISRIEKSIKSQSFLNKVFNDENGKPHLCGIDSSDISISHDGEYAVATVILW